MKFQEPREQSSGLLWLSRHVSHVGKSVGDAGGTMETQAGGGGADGRWRWRGKVELQVERGGAQDNPE